MQDEMNEGLLKRKKEILRVLKRPLPKKKADHEKEERHRRDLERELKQIERKMERGSVLNFF